jgi:outer membrane protein TolC
MSLDALVREAAEQNPEIRAAEQRFEAARATISPAQTLPDPTIGVEYRDLETRETMYGVTQELPFPGKLKLRGEIAGREADQAEQEYLAVRLATISALKQAYFDLHVVYQSIDIFQRNKALLREFEESAKASYTVGRGAQQDVFRAQTEVSRVLTRLAALDQQRVSLQAEINRLLNRPPSQPLGVPEQPQLTRLRRSMEEFNAAVDQSAPLLRAQMMGVERAQGAVKLAHREYYPDFEISAGGMHEEPMGTDGYRVMLNVRVPLYYARRQSFEVRGAVASREAALNDLQATRQDLLFRIQDNVAQVHRSEELVALLESALIPQARLTLSAAQAGYGVAKVDFLTLLNALLTLQDNELELHMEIAAHEQAMARLEEIIGEPP